MLKRTTFNSLLLQIVIGGAFLLHIVSTIQNIGSNGHQVVPARNANSVMPTTSTRCAVLATMIGPKAKSLSSVRSGLTGCDHYVFMDTSTTHMDTTGWRVVRLDDVELLGAAAVATIAKINKNATTVPQARAATVALYIKTHFHLFGSGLSLGGRRWVLWLGAFVELVCGLDHFVAGALSAYPGGSSVHMFPSALFVETQGTLVENRTVHATKRTLTPVHDSIRQLRSNTELLREAYKHYVRDDGWCETWWRRCLRGQTAGIVAAVDNDQPYTPPPLVGYAPHLSVKDVHRIQHAAEHFGHWSTNFILFNGRVGGETAASALLAQWWSSAFTDKWHAEESSSGGL
eukprot:PhM_4_TR9620/c0_g1_i1/m.22861